MYPQYGEHRFPSGQEFATGQARVPVDHARYPYHGYYNMKGSEGSQYAGMAAQRGAIGSPYAKHPRMPTPDGMYGQGWNSNAMNYMVPQSKSIAGSYPMQVYSKAFIRGVFLRECIVLALGNTFLCLGYCDLLSERLRRGVMLFDVH